MESLRLRDGISFGSVDGELIFLDLRKDRYFALRGQSACALRSLIADPSAELDGPDMDCLKAAGLFAPCEAPSLLRAAAADIPVRSLFETPGADARPSGLDLIEIIARLATIKRSLSRGRLYDRVGGIGAAKERRRRVGRRRDPLPLARRFNAARRLAPVAPNCLADSLALAGFLLSRGAAADLVFGVKLTPFAAHAWVQTQDEILNDHVDHVHEFTPVLVA